MMLQNVAVFLVYVTELFVYCFVGEFVSGNMLEVSSVVYKDLNWYCLPPRLRRHLLMLMLSSQKEFHLDGFGLSAVSCRMETFATVRGRKSDLFVFKIAHKS